jgi:RNA polymerase sigma-70 factor (ECF subfamily)
MSDASAGLDRLLDRCRQGDDVAWEILVGQTQGRVYAITLQYLRDREEARDVAQEVFVKLYKNVHRVAISELSGTLLAWLLRTARNASLDRLRRRKARRHHAQVPVDDARELSDPAATPEEVGLATARRALVHRALGELAPESREMILLKEIQQMKLTEIAELLGLPVGTVKSRSHRARAELARVVESLDGQIRDTVGGWA